MNSSNQLQKAQKAPMYKQQCQPQEQPFCQKCHKIYPTQNWLPLNSDKPPGGPGPHWKGLFVGLKFVHPFWQHRLNRKVVMFQTYWYKVAHPCNKCRINKMLGFWTIVLYCEVDLDLVTDLKVGIIVAGCTMNGSFGIFQNILLKVWVSLCS